MWPQAATVCDDVLRAVDLNAPALAGVVTESLGYSTLQAGGSSPRGFGSADPPRRRSCRTRWWPTGTATRCTSGSTARAAQRVLQRCPCRAARGPRRRPLRPVGRRSDPVRQRPSFCSGVTSPSSARSPTRPARTSRASGTAPRWCSMNSPPGSASLPARVHGQVLGSGLEMAAFCGWVEAHRDSVFGLPEMSLGLIPGAGGTVSVTRRIGRWRTAYLVLSGRTIDAHTALDWALVDAIERRRSMQNGLVGSLGIPDAVLARAVAHDICRSAADLGGNVSVDADEILTGRADCSGSAPAGRISAADRHGCCPPGTAGAPSRCRAPTTSRRFPRFSNWPNNHRTLGGIAPRPPTATRTSSSRGPGCSTCPPPCSVKSVPRQHDSCPAAAARRGDCPSCWSPTCRRCGRAAVRHLLAAAGATVVKVEGRSRPDGTRGGDPRFFDWMNSSKLSYAIDFRDDDLRQLLEVADVVIEGSAGRADPPRPRPGAGAWSPRPSGCG